jgi:hypothetical protein
MRLGGLKPQQMNAMFLAFVVALAALVISLVRRAGGPGVNVLAYVPNVRFYLFILVVYVCCAVFYLLVRHRPASPARFLLQAEPPRGLWRAVVDGLPLLLAIGIFMPSFSFVKSSIPLFNPYQWDATFISLDQAIHGTDPWRLLQPVLGYPIVTATLAAIYHLWFLLIYLGGVFFAVAVRDHELRSRYFLSYFLMWTLGGMAMAVGLASVGPCFLDPLLGNGHFTEQMAYLEAANRQYPVAVLEVQHELIAWYRMGDFGLGRGISAMPSMHVALSFLFFLAVRQVSRPAGWFFGAFCFTIMVASIHLGYHYAMDGYVSIALVSAIWWLSGKIVPRLLGPPRESEASIEVHGIPAQA